MTFMNCLLKSLIFLLTVFFQLILFLRPGEKCSTIQTRRAAPVLPKSLQDIGAQQKRPQSVIRPAECSALENSGLPCILPAVSWPSSPWQQLARKHTILPPRPLGSPPTPCPPGPPSSAVLLLETSQPLTPKPAIKVRVIALAYPCLAL